MNDKLTNKTFISFMGARIYYIGCALIFNNFNDCKFNFMYASHFYQVCLSTHFRTAKACDVIITFTLLYLHSSPPWSVNLKVEVLGQCSLNLQMYVCVCVCPYLKIIISLLFAFEVTWLVKLAAILLSIDVHVGVCTFMWDRNKDEWDVQVRPIEYYKCHKIPNISLMVIIE